MLEVGPGNLLPIHFLPGLGVDDHIFDDFYAVGDIEDVAA